MTGFGSETAIQFNLEPRTQRRSSLSSMLGIDHGYLTCDARPGCTMAWTAATLTTPPTHYSIVACTIMSDRAMPTVDASFAKPRRLCELLTARKTNSEDGTG